MVGDHEHRLVHRDLAPVEQSQRFARPRASHDDAAVDLAPVIGMHRLAELEHDVVRDVDDRADRTQPGASQALAHPERRLRTGVQPADHARGEAHAARTRLSARPAPYRSPPAATAAIAGATSACTGQRRDLARDSEHAHAVAAVRRQVEPEHDVVERERCRPAAAPWAGPRAARADRTHRPTGRARAPSRACRTTPRRAAWPCGSRVRPAASRRPWRAAPSCRRARSARRRRPAASRDRWRPGRASGVSAFGCRATESTSPTITPASGGAAA